MNNKQLLASLPPQMRRTWQRMHYGGQLPDFLVIGTQKGGTTSLHELLNMHSQVFLPSIKEVHYFTKHADKSARWYAQFFAQARINQWCGDITPYYLFHPHAAPRIKKLLPHVPMIAMLRDPVERALSHYFMKRRHGDEHLALPQAIAAEPERLHNSVKQIAHPGLVNKHHMMHSYVSRSRYDTQLKHFFQFFPRSQILVLQSEQFFAKPTASWQRILRFLGIPPAPLPKQLPRANSGNNEAAEVPAHIRAMLRTKLAPTYQWLDAEYGIRWKTPKY